MKHTLDLARRAALTSSGSAGIERILEDSFRGEPDIDGLAAATDETVQVLVWNYHDDIAPAAPASVQLTVEMPGPSGSRARVTHYRIDGTHSNAYTRWLSLNSPQQPTLAVMAELRAAAELELLEPIRFSDVADGQLRLDFELPRHGVSLIELRCVP
ncbi:MAG: hypothetical protein JSU94_08535 [Phycisphaerales bacterium]|nr:MAG: hypothetical protein JSU94_08535 [Phycisphaerales bacterium]